MMKKFAVVFVILLVVSASRITPVLALEDGAYVVSNNAYYTNPDTGVADDGGDTSIGEGMSRNVTYEQSLYELKDGKHMVTVRINMISYISKVTFNVQTTKGDSEDYKSVSYTVVGENKEEDTKDFRFEMPAADMLIKPVLYVEPMNRDVTYFIALDMSTAKADKGGFAAFNKSGETNDSANQDQDVLPEDVTNLPEDIQTKVQEADADSIATKQNTPKEGAASPAQGDAEGKASSTGKSNEKAKPASTADAQNKPAAEPAAQTTEAKEPAASAADVSGIDSVSASDAGAKNGQSGNMETSDSDADQPQEDEVAGIVQYSAEGAEIPVNDNKNEQKSGSPLFLYAASGLVVVAGIAAWWIYRLRKNTAK